MSDEDDIEDQADLDDAFYDDDMTDLSETTVDEALATNFDRKSSRQMLEERLEQKKLRESLDDDDAIREDPRRHEASGSRKAALWVRFHAASAALASLAARSLTLA